jgi:hypothetical protein
MAKVVNFKSFPSLFYSVRKNYNFFDDDDKKSDTDVGEGFETFENDKDFADMRSSQHNVSDEADNEDLGASWGGKAYSFQQGSND